MLWCYFRIKLLFCWLNKIKEQAHLAREKNVTYVMASHMRTYIPNRLAFISFQSVTNTVCTESQIGTLRLAGTLVIWRQTPNIIHTCIDVPYKYIRIPTYDEKDCKQRNYFLMQTYTILYCIYISDLLVLITMQIFHVFAKSCSMFLCSVYGTYVNRILTST
jgi:hypothetical protein